MNVIPTTWLDSEPCPACGTRLHCTDDGTVAVTRDCPACGWTAVGDLASEAGAVDERSCHPRYRLNLAVGP